MHCSLASSTVKLRDILANCDPPASYDIACFKIENECIFGS